MEIRRLIAEYGAQGIPKKEGSAGGEYGIRTTTPNGRTFYFQISALKGQTLTYGTISTTISGLKEFMVEKRHFSNMLFGVETRGQIRVVGGLSMVEKPTNGNFSSTTSGGNSAIELRCTWGDPLDEDAIKSVLRAARTKVDVMIYSTGLDGKLPGEAGDWSTEEDSKDHKATFSIAGKPPAHLTWGNMKDVVSAFRDMTNNLFPGFQGITGKAAECEILSGTTKIGTLSVK
ncbi:MAG: hypothetical protein Q9168_006450 [Polycauliona sp. 1 TL-2023]